VFESLSGRRRTNAKRSYKAGRFGDNIGRYDQDTTNENRNWAKNMIGEHSGVRNGADGTLMCGKLRIFGMYVNRLNNSNEDDEQGTEERHRCGKSVQT
jgi:hypothetical protein